MENGNPPWFPNKQTQRMMTKGKEGTEETLKQEKQTASEYNGNEQDVFYDENVKL